MYLKSIELYGFKSFAERTKIELNDNITCVVGPNGSGKSNITDAIRWALGEQSYSALRGSKMSDVIFSGTSSRRALGMAEVILTFDNSSNFLNVDYSEVQIKRKLYKNGDSEYSINNNSCRLKDVRELFMDTGIGRDGYSIISQGKIDEILSSKPIERRVIFEEASGISKYKSQKNEVERKLKRTNENLIRISDLLVEIKNQKDTLKEESKIALRYNELFEKIKVSEISKNYEDIRNFKVVDLELEKNYSEANESKSKLIEIISKHEDNYKNIEDQLNEIELEIAELQGQNIENIRNEKDLTNKININREKIQSKKDDINDYAARLKIKEEEIVSRKSELDAALDDLEKYNLNRSKSLEVVLQYNIDKNKLDENINKLEEESNGYLSQIALEEDKLNKNQIKRDTLHSLNSERKNAQIKINTQFERLEKNNEDMIFSLNKLEQSIKDIEAEIDKNTQLIDLELQGKNIIETKTAEYVQEKGKNFEALNGKSARLSTLINMEQSYEGYNKSIRDFFRVVNKRDLSFPELHDTVANLIGVEEKYEKAISTALGGNTQNLIVDTFASAQKIINFLKNEKLGRITFLPLDNIKNYRKKIQINHPGFIDFASNLIKFDKKYLEIFEFLLGNIAIVDSLDNGNKIAKSAKQSIKIVTLDGDVINPGGSVSGGYINTAGNIFNRKNELKSLKKEVDFHKVTIQNLDNKISIERSKILEVENNLNFIKEKVASLNEEKTKTNSRLIELKLSNESNRNNILEYEEQVKNYDLQILETKKIIENLTAEEESSSNSISELESKKQLIDEKVSELQKKKDSVVEFITKTNLELANIDSEIGFTNRTITRLKEDCSKIKNEISSLNQKIEDYTKEIDVFEKENILDESTLSKLILVNGRFDKVNLELQKKRKLIFENYNTLTQDINENKGKLLDLEKELYFVNTQLENSKEKIDNLIIDIQESYNFTIEPEILLFDDYKTKITKTAIKNMKQEIGNLGNVNLGAISSYREAEERYAFTKNQHLDLIQSEKSLKELLKEIEMTMEEKFNESFKEINNNFNRIFKYLFNGGRAELALEEAESFEDSGVDIIAQLPGKKRQLLDAMSGGERSLTTVALLFALLETRPAPFCLLDEVDAALDESNIKRFLSYLINLSNIQFAIITHRKTTMTAADYLYGITMEEAGVSKVISLKFGERNEKNVQMA